MSTTTAKVFTWFNRWVTCKVMIKNGYSFEERDKIIMCKWWWDIFLTCLFKYNSSCFLREEKEREKNINNRITCMWNFCKTFNQKICYIFMPHNNNNNRPSFFLCVCVLNAFYDYYYFDFSILNHNKLYCSLFGHYFYYYCKWTFSLAYKSIIHRMKEAWWWRSMLLLLLYCNKLCCVNFCQP